MDYKKLKKPEHLKEEVWEQHLDWLNVMGRQLEDNIQRHEARVREDASRSEALEPMHQEVLASPHRTQSMFCPPKD